MVYSEGEKVDFKLEYPLRFLVSGSTRTGKTYFIEKLLKQSLCKNIEDIYYFGEKKHHKYKSFIGLPKDTDFARNSCIVIDNLYESAINSKIVYNLFKYSGEKKISVFLTTQDLSAVGKYSSSIQNNCNYLVLFSNTNRILNRQLAHDKDLDASYKIALDHVSDRPHSAITINQSQQSKIFKLFTYISDRKIEAFDKNGKLLLLFSREELEKYCEIVNTEDGHFCAINNED